MSLKQTNTRLTADSTSSRLRQETRSHHDRLDATPFARTLAGGTVSKQGFVSYLRAMAVVHASLERALTKDCKTNPNLAVWDSAMARLPLLLADLDHLQDQAFDDSIDVGAEALAIAANIRLRSVKADSTPLLGYLYVLESSKQGGALAKRKVESALGLDGTKGITYLGDPEGRGADTWKRFKQRLDAIVLSPAAQDEVVAAASELYDGVVRIFQALDPLRPKDKAYMATSFNPEAGNHPVPNDPREIEAALAAGRISWQEIPYLETRYGERGKRFTTSDSAWLTTLSRAPEAIAVRQILWLGRVLAARGMPRLILEMHLLTLSAELTRCVPENKASYLRLAIAANVLRKARLKRIDADKFAQIAAHFDAVAATTDSAGLRAGPLLVAAVCDETDGVQGAIESLESWLISPSRFCSTWISAVQETIAKARMATADESARI